MPRHATSDSEEEVTSTKKKQVVEEEQEVDVADSVEEDEQEYEIEAIIKASLSVFPEGKLGYFVKWKDFGEGDNSWVCEEDAEGAHDLIHEFWKKHPNKMREKSAIGRKVAKEVEKKESASASASASASKRRPRATAKYETDGEEEQEESKTKKRPRKSNGSAAPAKKSKTRTPSVDEEEVTEINNYFHPIVEKKYKELPSWENLVTRIDTVERSAKDDSLYVYFQMKSQPHPCVEKSEVAMDKFPRKLIQFYEGNLRWKSSEGA
ncbi:hypothetical protein OF83DRAFT_1172581 [Amylostereum chailletii]|nr:hypothetical protein OF83DRAFT_1172581 [Amylostereum chailletii]